MSTIPCNKEKAARVMSPTRDGKSNPFDGTSIRAFMQIRKVLQRPPSSYSIMEMAMLNGTHVPA